MTFLVFTNADDQPILVNLDQVQSVEPNGSRSKLNLSGGGHLRVQESFDQVQARLCPTPAPDHPESTDAADHPAKTREKK